MWALVLKDFMYHRKFLLQIGFIFAAIIVLFGQGNPDMVAVYFRILPIVMGMTLPQTIFSYEERGNTFVFLRSLPVRPNQIVAAKYVFSLLLVAGIGLLSLGLSSMYATESSPFDPHLVIFMSSALMALSLYLHFRLGVNSAKMALLTLLLGSGVIIGGIVSWPQARQLLDSFLPAELPTALSQFASTHLSLLITVALAASILFISYLASTGIFSRRDVTQLP